MKIAYLSDLHLEINGRWRKDNWPDADVLVIAGDLVPVRYLKANANDPQARSIKRMIASLKQTVFPRYAKVFMVMGNHEHYGNQFNKTYSELKDRIFDYNFHLLENESVEYNGIHFLGCTLWTDCNNHDPIAENAIRMGMNDYKMIWTEQDPIRPNNKKKLRPEDTIEEHWVSKDFLHVELAKTLPSVVITHHAPLLNSPSNQTSGDLLDYAYGSNLEGLIEAHDNLKLWIHGHTHIKCDYEAHGTRIVSNACGYYNRDFNLEDGVVEI